MTIEPENVFEFFPDQKFFWPLDSLSASSLTGILEREVFYSSLEEFLKDYYLIDYNEGNYKYMEIDENERLTDEKILLLFKDWSFSSILLSALFFECFEGGKPNSIDKRVWLTILTGILYTPYSKLIYSAFKEANFFKLSKNSFKSSLHFYFILIFVKNLEKNKFPKEKNFILLLQALELKQEIVESVIYQFYHEKNLEVAEYYFTKFLEE